MVDLNTILHLLYFRKTVIVCDILRKTKHMYIKSLISHTLKCLQKFFGPRPHALHNLQVMAMRWHPDRPHNRDKGVEATNNFRTVKAAYDPR